MSLSRTDVRRTILRSMVVAAVLSATLTYVLYESSPGLLIQFMCETLAIPSEVAVLHLHWQSALFETFVNFSFYSVVISALALTYRAVVSNRD